VACKPDRISQFPWMCLFFQAKESWSLDSAEKIEQAKFFKEKGTNYFRNEKYALALKMYKKAVNFVEFDSGKCKSILKM
jgi:hypothetical protein